MLLSLQVDLSDDYVLFMMFADGQWENDMTPIEFEEDGGQTKQLTMTEKEFHEVSMFSRGPGKSFVCVSVLGAALVSSCCAVQGS